VPPLFVRTVHGIGYAFSGEASGVDAGRAADPPGAPRFWVVWRQRAIVLHHEDTVIGRDPTCAVWIEAEGVSRRHARIRVPPEGAKGPALIEDLDSTNGTYLRGTRVVRVEPLEDGDQVRIGRAAITFRAWKEAGAVTKRVRPSKR
jgi:pSer/pThr/pTyr-binding forkhead associated (FHA) protein